MTLHSDSLPLSLDRVSLLRQALAQQFSNRPTLRSVVADLLDSTLKKHFSGVSPSQDVNRLYIVLAVDESEQPLVTPRYRLLLEAMLEHIAVGTPMNYGYYTPEQCFMAALAEGAQPSAIWQPLVSMREVEGLMREIEHDWTDAFQQSLVDYWNLPLPGFWSRLHRFQHFLGDNLRAAANTGAGLTSNHIEVLQQVLSQPVLADRLQRFGSNAQPKVYFAQIQAVAGKRTYQKLLVDVLVVHLNNGIEQLLQCKPSGQIQVFATLKDFGLALGRDLDSRYLIDSVTWKRYEPMVNFLQVQAMLVLDTHLKRIAAIKRLAPQSGGLANLERQLLRSTDPCSIFDNQPEAPSELLGQVFNALPGWLKNASLDDRAAYRSHVIELADATRKAQGHVFNEGILDIHGYAVQALKQAMLSDHPLAPSYDPDDIEIEFTVATGPFGTMGTIKTFTYTLTELALQNLIGMPSGHMTIRHAHNQLIQDWWMTPDYIKSLIQKVNVGQAYPALIKRLLLDDVDEAQKREQLYVDQLRATLPMLALEIKLRGQGTMSQWGYRCVSALMQRDPASRVLDGQSVGIRPLAFVRAPAVAPDFVRNMFVIGSSNQLPGPCVLYRPLFKESLIEYPSASALVDAIVCEGAVRTSVLEWLPSAFKATYEHWVLHPSNLMAAPPASPALLFIQPLNTHFMHDLFKESAMTLMQLADLQSVSNVESRWATLKEGGWLLFNTLLPLIRGPVAVLGWLFLTVSALKNDISELRSDDERARAPAIIDLLFNIAVVLLHGAQNAQSAHGLEHSDLLLEGEDESPATLVDTALPRQPIEQKPESKTLTVTQGQVYLPGVPVGDQYAQLDFSWFKSPRINYSQTQMTWLDLNRGQDLGQALPVTLGQYKGLYVVDNKWHALVRGFSYQVSLEEEGVVMVSPRDEFDTGSWLYRNDAGEWDFDTRQRLCGGGPKKSQRLRARVAQNNTRIEELNANYEAFRLRWSQLGQHINDERLRVNEAIQGAASQPLSSQEQTELLQGFRSKVEHTIAEYTAGLDDLKERITLRRFENDHEMLSAFYEVLFTYSGDLLYVQSRLTEKLRGQYPQFSGTEQRTLNPRDLNPDDAPGYVGFIRALFAIQHVFLTDFQKQAHYLNELREVPRGGQKSADELAKAHIVVISSSDSVERRATDIDFMKTQIGLLMDLAPETVFGETWDSLSDIISPLTYTVNSHAELADTGLFSHSERIEILGDIGQRYARAQDALAILYLQASDQFNVDDFNRLTDMVGELNARAEEQRAEETRQQTEWLPKQSKPSPKPHSAKKIIRTRKQGILIGVARTRASDQEPLIVDVGGLSASGAGEQPGSQSSGMPTLTFRQSGADQWEPMEPAHVALVPTRTLKVIKQECAKLLGKIDAKIKQVKGYSKQSRFPLELEEILERDALKLEALIGEIETHLGAEAAQDKPEYRTVESLLKRLRESATRLREQAIWILKSLPPSESTVDFLLAKGEVTIVKSGARKPMKGERQDFVQEYEIRHNKNQVLWYAHLHYETLTGPGEATNAAHFKLKAQRMASQQSLDAKAKSGEKAERVYYGKISPRMVVERFMKPDA